MGSDSVIKIAFHFWCVDLIIIFVCFQIAISKRVFVIVIQLFSSFVCLIYAFRIVYHKNMTLHHYHLFVFFHFSYVMTTNIKGTDVSIFCILDGHGGEFAAVFGKEHLMDKLTKKIVEAIDISSGKVSPLPIRRNSLIMNVNDQQEPIEKKEDKEPDESPQIARTASQRRKLKKTLSSDNDCNSAKSNCNQEQDSFLGKLSSIRITKESFLKKDKIVKPNEYEASYYVDKNSKINFGKMVTDLVLLTDYELIEKAKKQVSSRIIIRFDLKAISSFVVFPH